MMRPLTIPEHNILALIPSSAAGGSWHTQSLLWKIQNALNISAETLNVYMGNFIEAGLIQTIGGFTKRTLDGDRALDPVGAVEHAQGAVQS